MLSSQSACLCDAFSLGSYCSTAHVNFLQRCGGGMAQTLEALKRAQVVTFIGSFYRDGFALCPLPWRDWLLVSAPSAARRIAPLSPVAQCYAARLAGGGRLWIFVLWDKFFVLCARVILRVSCSWPPDGLLIFELSNLLLPHCILYYYGFLSWWIWYAPLSLLFIRSSVVLFGYIIVAMQGSATNHTRILALALTKYVSMAGRCFAWVGGTELARLSIPRFSGSCMSPVVFLRAFQAKFLMLFRTLLCTGLPCVWGQIWCWRASLRREAWR